ncbi:type II secretion system protein GspL [Nevskia sp.]|uniref:type II secretion system protein GspL n=1 Tax=Nevskia sp. TaxID=1929292 RepID=UPI0025F7F485|nr:type II secretion system protein GspL [Nevskia sp.]
MRDTLYIRLRDTAPDALTAYALVSSEPLDASLARPGVLVRELPLDEVVALGAGRRVVVFVPGVDVRLTTVTVPARQPAKVLQAAPFVLEDQFAEDVDTLHFAIGTRLGNGSFPIAVVARSHVDEWLAPFNAARVRVAALVPDTLALPWQNDGPWSVLPDAGQMIVRSGAYAGFSCVPEDFDLLLELAENGTQASLRVLVARDDATDYTRLNRPLHLLPGFDHPLEAMVRYWKPAQSIDLLQASYSQRDDMNRYWQPWKLAAQLAAAALVLGIGLNIVESSRLKAELAGLQASNEQTFRRLFPRETKIINLEAQVEQQLRLLRGGSSQTGLFELMQSAASGLSENPGLTLRNIQFREGALFLDLSGSDLQVLEKLRTWFNSHRGAKLDVESADSNENGVQIRLKLTSVAA